MKLDLSGGTALVTGGAKRIGRAISLTLGEHAANVVVHHRSSKADADALVGEINGLGARGWSVEADLADPQQLDGLVGRAVELAGSIDILVNNASEFPRSTFESFTLDELAESINVNAWAPLALGRAFAARVERGHIVNVLDTRIAGYDWNHVAYHAGKTLLALFTREMALKFAPKIAVNAVAPGLILPPAGKDRAYLEALRESLPLQRVGDPQDVADAVLFLVTSSFITGQVIFTDGGRHLLGARDG